MEEGRANKIGKMLVNTFAGMQNNNSEDISREQTVNGIGKAEVEKEKIKWFHFCWQSASDVNVIIRLNIEKPSWNSSQTGL